MSNPPIDIPTRPAFVEIDLKQLHENFKIILHDKPDELNIVTVVKDQAYGHGAEPIAKAALEHGSNILAVATLDEALALRKAGISVPILIFGERTSEELPVCIENNCIVFVNDIPRADELNEMGHSREMQIPVHVEVDTGLSRYGVRWAEAVEVIKHVAECQNLHLEGVMSHFAMSDELDKTFALEQIERFQKVLQKMEQAGIRVKYRHMCNTGGFLDLPQAHFDLVRIGILHLGVYPSQVCRRISGLQPIMSVKSKIAAIREIQQGDIVGYGLRYRAESRRRIAVIPMGYGDGYPRVRNKGEVLVHGKRVPIIGGNAMDATMIDITDIPQSKMWDDVILMGKQGDDEIDVHEIAALKGSVSYDILAGWRERLPRIYKS